MDAQASLWHRVLNRGLASDPLATVAPRWQQTSATKQLCRDELQSISTNNDTHDAASAKRLVIIDSKTLQTIRMPASLTKISIHA
eukprot:3679548-Amphidinium_carterae.2